MTHLGFERYCAEVVGQARDLTDLTATADPAAPVPTCPGWTLTDLRRHIGSNLLTVATAVRTGVPATGPDGDIPDAPGALPMWVTGAASEFARVLRAAGPDRTTEVWGLAQPSGYWARRAVHDLVVHRADAAGAVGAPFTVAPDLGADTVDELLDLAPDLRTADRLAAPPARTGTLRFRAEADGTGDPGARWTLRVDPAAPDGFHRSRTADTGADPAGDGADVTARGALPDVLRLIHRRLTPGDPRVTVTGDDSLLAFWLDRVSVG